MGHHEEQSKFFRCSCGAEGLVITDCIDWLERETTELGHQEFYFAVFNYYNSTKPGIKERLRYAWTHILRGKYYTDEVIFERDKILEIIDHLQQRINAYVDERCQ
jgi:hypothetical protein